MSSERCRSSAAMDRLSATYGAITSRATTASASTATRNFFMLFGSNTGLGHNSVVTMIAAQARYIKSCLMQMRRQRLKVINIKPEVQDQFFERIQEQLKRPIGRITEAGIGIAPVTMSRSCQASPLVIVGKRAAPSSPILAPSRPEPRDMTSEILPLFQPKDRP
jgi:hypothetical protein